jgi:hypothetical protein
MEKELKNGGRKTGKKFWKKKGFYLGLIIILALIILVTGIIQKQIQSLDPDLAAKAMEASFSADTYRFSGRSVLYINDEERVFSAIQGEKSGNARHIKGSILGSEINIFSVDDVFYQQNPLDGVWQKITDKTLADAVLLWAELDPENNFDFAALGDAVDLGFEEIDGQKARCLELYPTMNDAWIERYFQDIVCRLWIYGRKPYLVKAYLEGTSKENPAAKLVIENYFSDYGKNIVIEAPM